MKNLKDKFYTSTYISIVDGDIELKYSVVDCIGTNREEEFIEM